MPAASSWARGVSAGPLVFRSRRRAPGLLSGSIRTGGPAHSGAVAGPRRFVAGSPVG